MTKKLLKFVAISLGLVVLSTTLSFSQEEKKELKRPSKCGVSEVDIYVNKSFDAYEESKAITKAANFIKVEGEGDSKVIKNADGQELSKSDALLQLGELLTRAKKQSENVKGLQEAQKPATESIKKAAIPKKPQATKNLNSGNEAMAEVAKETKKQVELIEKQISDVKGMKE
ncbi:MAG: hypothetical protein CVT98_06300 [Bacteroidetes bacterium HGW-Bacteroidetes-15]|nr:MAG: hypothetical protein CVT98_06300 [Bacteroidetes bacterium HGW-Bacteroidetes-15]